MNCEICQKTSGTRIVIGVHMCEMCYSKIVKLRNKDSGSVAFFLNRFNYLHATDNAKRYIDSLMPEDAADIVKESDEVAATALIDAAQREDSLHTSSAPTAISTGCEYKIASVLNLGNGPIDKGKVERVISEHVSEGYRLHTMYTNILSPAGSIMAGCNPGGQAAETIMVFER